MSSKTSNARQNIYRRGSLSALAIAVMMASGASWAQESDDENDAEFLGELTLGTSKRAIQTDTAEAKTVIDQAEIDDRQANTIAELVDSAPGVQLVNGSTPTGSGLNIRGFGANGTFGTDQKVAIIIDGATTGAEELYRIGNQLFTDPYLYKRVEVIRGTMGSFEYGSGLVGGTVRLETKDASDFTGGETGFALGVTAGYFNNRDGYNTSLTAAYQASENVELLANFSYRDQMNQQDGDGEFIGNSAFDLPSFLLKARVGFGESHSLMASFTQSETSERDVPYDTFFTTTDAFGNVDRDTTSQTFTAVYTYDPFDSDLINFDIALTYANQEIDGAYVPGSSALESNPFFGPVVIALGDADHQYETTRLTFRNEALMQTGGLNHRLRSGVEFIVRDRADAQSAPGGTDDRIAVFLIDEIDFGNGFTVTPALRYVSSSIDADPFTPPAAPGAPPGSPVGVDVTNEAFMGGVSVRYAFENGFSVFGSVARTEQLPIIDDAENAQFIRQSEIGDTTEFGVAYDAVGLFGSGDTLALKVNYYDTVLEDVTSYSGIDEIEISGFEVEASLAFDSGTYFDLNGAFIADSKQIPIDPAAEASEFDRAPVDNFRLTLGHRFGRTADLSWEVVNNSSDDRVSPLTGVSGESFTIHNLRLTLIPQDTLLGDTQIRLGVENLADESYIPLLSTRPAVGRNFKFTLSTMF
ncbi:MAG: TonB-dependent receptor [Pseudomonadota bacterium]